MADPISRTGWQPRHAKRLKTSNTMSSTTQAETVSVPVTSPLNDHPAVENAQEPVPTQDDVSITRITDGTRRKTKTVKRRKPDEGQEQTEVNAVKEKRTRSRKRREPTPENAEFIEISPAVVKMSELCKDLRTGRKSKREAELQNMEQAKLERIQNGKEERENSSNIAGQPEAGDNASSPTAEETRPPQKPLQTGPRMRILNGDIVLDPASLQVDRHANAAAEAGELEDVTENPLTRKINQASFGKRTQTQSWSEEMTDLFYRGLRMFGTDFMIISRLFPGRSRRQIKLKFNNEERRNPEKIKEALLGPHETIDIATFSEMTNTVYDDPQVIQRELDEEKKRIEDQHAKQKLGEDVTVFTLQPV